MDGLWRGSWHAAGRRQEGGAFAVSRLPGHGDGPERRHGWRGGQAATCCERVVLGATQAVERPSGVGGRESSSVRGGGAGTMLYAAETWVLRADEMKRLAVFGRGRVRWVAGIRGRRSGWKELEQR